MTRKRSCFLLVILVSSLFMGCRSYYTEEYVPIQIYRYKTKDYITKVLEVYEPEKLLFPVLDSIIIKTEECPEYQNRKEKIFFYFCIKNGNFAGNGYDCNDPKIGIFANYYYFYLSDFTSVEGLFHYNGYDFYIEEKEVDILLKKTEQTISIRCVAPEKYHFDPLYRGDADMYWWYRYKHGTLINTQYGYCSVSGY